MKGNILKTEENKNVKKFFHIIKPIRKTYIEKISETTIDLDATKFSLQGTGYLQIGEIIYDIDDAIVKKVITDWNDNLINSSAKKINLQKGSKLKNLSSYISFITGEASEIVVLDLMIDSKGKPLVISTTELFNHEKLFSFKTSLQSGLKPGEVNIPPHIIVNLPAAYLTVGEKEKFKFINYDPDGKISKLIVDWGDGSKEIIKEPRDTDLELYHKYTEKGIYKIKITAKDNSSKSNNISSTIIEMKTKKEEQKSKSSGSKKTSKGNYLIAMELE